MRDSLVAVDQTLADNHLPTCTEEEIESYVWADNPDGTPSKEQPKKVNDHGMDTLRYAVCFVDGVGAELTEQEEIVIYRRQYSISPV
jgi:hypothetical protein